MKCNEYINELNKVIEIPLENRNLYETLLSCPTNQAKFIIKNKAFGQIYEALPQKIKEKLKKNNSTQEIERKEIEKFTKDQQILQSHQAKIEDYLNNLKHYASFGEIFENKEFIEKVKTENFENYTETALLYNSKMEYKFLLEFSNEIKKRYSYYTMAYNLFAQRSAFALKKYNKVIRKYYVYHIYKSGKNEIKLISYDIEKHEKIEKPFNSDILGKMVSYSLLLPIPDFNLFIFGCDNTDLRFIFALDMKNLAVDLLLQGKLNWNVGGTYYKKFVYIFGGISNEGISAQAKKFDLSLRKFIDLASLPQFSQFCSCIPFKGSILVCGYQHRKIYEYDIKNDTYSEAKINVEIGRKILLEANERVYVFESAGNIYESSPSSIKSWTIIGKNQIQGEQFYTIYYMGNFIFGLTRFNQFEEEEDGGSFTFFAFDLKHRRMSNWAL